MDIEGEVPACSSRVSLVLAVGQGGVLTIPSPAAPQNRALFSCRQQGPVALGTLFVLLLVLLIHPQDSPDPLVKQQAAWEVCCGHGPLSDAAFAWRRCI